MYLSEEEKEKYLVAQQLGLFEKLQEVGWGGLTASESGRVGGYISKLRKSKKD